MLGDAFVEFAGQFLTGAFPESFFQKLTGLAALAAGKALGREAGLTRRGNDDFNDLVQWAPPICTVSFTLPSDSGCSKTVCPFLRASIFDFSTA